MVSEDANPVRIEEKVVEIEEHRVKILFVQIYRTFLVWIGDLKDPKLNSLSVALGNNSTSIIIAGNQPIDSTDKEMAEKLSKRFNDNGPVYVGYNYVPAINDLQLKLKLDEHLIKFIHSIYSS